MPSPRDIQVRGAECIVLHVETRLLVAGSAAKQGHDTDSHTTSTVTATWPGRHETASRQGGSGHGHADGNEDDGHHHPALLAHACPHPGGRCVLADCRVRRRCCRRCRENRRSWTESCTPTPTVSPTTSSARCYSMSMHECGVTCHRGAVDLPRPLLPSRVRWCWVASTRCRWTAEATCALRKVGDAAHAAWQP